MTGDTTRAVVSRAAASTRSLLATLTVSSTSALQHVSVSEADTRQTKQGSDQLAIDCHAGQAGQRTRCCPAADSDRCAARTSTASCWSSTPWPWTALASATGSCLSAPAWNKRSTGCISLGSSSTVWRPSSAGTSPFPLEARAARHSRRAHTLTHDTQLAIIGKQTSRNPTQPQPT